MKTNTSKGDISGAKSSKMGSCQQGSYKQADYKQVILVRGDLGLPKGKMAAQAAHAAVEAVIRCGVESSAVRKWYAEGMAKIVLRVKDEDELVRYFQMAKDSGLSASLITDAGRTVVESGTKTCVAIGPGDAERIDRITGKLVLM